MKGNISANFFSMAVFVAGLALIVVALAIIEPPHTARMRSLDEKKVNNLMQLKYTIESYRQQNMHNPATLADLNISEYTRNDIETGKPYEYRVLSPNSYELCAVFHTDMNQEEKTSNCNMFNDACELKTDRHKGRQCFTFNEKPVNKTK